MCIHVLCRTDFAFELKTLCEKHIDATLPIYHLCLTCNFVVLKHKQQLKFKFENILTRIQNEANQWEQTKKNYVELNTTIQLSVLVLLKSRKNIWIFCNQIAIWCKA